LLFSHKDNPLIKDFWIPWEEYVPYDDSNILELIVHYIKNPDEAKRIITNAKEKSKSIPASWGEFVWENINIAYKTDVSIQNRIKHAELMHLTVLKHCTATPFLYNYEYKTNFPENWRDLYFKRIDDALSFAINPNDRIAPLIEAARIAFLFKKFELTLKYLEELQKVLPDYAWIYYLLGRIYFERGENNQALLSLQKAVDCALKAPELLQQFVLPVIEDDNVCDGRRITNYIWQPVYNHNNEFQFKTLTHLALELTGVIYQHVGDINNSINSYIRAVEFVPIPDCIYKVNNLLIKSGEFGKLLQITEKGIEDSPYDSILILYKTYALIQLKQMRKACNVLNEHKKALRSFLGVRKIKIMRIVINLILPLLFFRVYPISKVIIEMISILKKKAGLTYLG
jgi:tetratricopeptide (TPR) repeat protein